MRYCEETLDNGLHIVAEANPSAYSASYGFFVRTGSRDETPELAGVSHFLEHMVFKGTERRAAADVNRELDEIGSVSNAETSEEHTAYYAAVLPEHQAAAVDLLADLMRPSLREEDFRTEKQVILEEIARYEDQPPFGAMEKALAAHFGGHPLGRPVLGTNASVTALTTSQMRGYLEQRYSPNNLALVAAGQVDFEQLVEQARRLCGGWRHAPAPRDTERPPSFVIEESLRKPIATQEYKLMVWDGPEANDPLRYATRLMCTMLGDDCGSRLFWELIDTGAAEYAVLFPHEFIGTGVILGWLSCAPDEAEANLAVYQDVLATAVRDGFTDDELERARNKVCSAVVRGGERPLNRLFSVGRRWLRGAPYRTVREDAELYKSVTLDQIHEVLERYPLGPCTRVSVGPAA